MAKFSIVDWSFRITEKYDSEIRVISKIAFYLLMAGFIGLFIKLGYDYSANTGYTTYQTILYGVLIAVGVIILFFVYHFSSGADFDLKWLGLPIGLAVGGSIVGLVGGISNKIIYWIIGIIAGGVIISFTAKYYGAKYKNST